jgi:hypothetical protein
MTGIPSRQLKGKNQQTMKQDQNKADGRKEHSK